MSMNFWDRVRPKWNERKYVCVGIDPRLENLPSQFQRLRPGAALYDFSKWVIDQTATQAATYKLNKGFYEAHGPQGIQALSDTVRYSYEMHDVLAIIDGKYNDIGNSSEAYLEGALKLGADAVTVNPSMGQDSLQPFLDQKHLGVIVLIRTSNPGATKFQDLLTKNPEYPAWGAEYEPQYKIVAREVVTNWNANGNVGLVVGATYPKELAEIREAVGDEVPVLIPGIGKQAGDLAATIKAAKWNFLINSSRDIMYGPDGPGAALAKLSASITTILEGVRS